MIRADFQQDMESVSYFTMNIVTENYWLIYAAATSIGLGPYRMGYYFQSLSYSKTNTPIPYPVDRDYIIPFKVGGVVMSFVNFSSSFNKTYFGTTVFLREFLWLETVRTGLQSSKHQPDGWSDWRICTLLSFDPHCGPGFKSHLSRHVDWVFSPYLNTWVPPYNIYSGFPPTYKLNTSSSSLRRFLQAYELQCYRH